MDVESLVRICPGEQGGPYHVVLGGGALPEVKFGPESNPAIAREMANNLKAFLQELIASLPERTTNGPRQVPEHQMSGTGNLKPDSHLTGLPT